MPVNFKLLNTINNATLVFYNSTDTFTNNGELMDVETFHIDNIITFTNN